MDTETAYFEDTPRDGYTTEIEWGLADGGPVATRIEVRSHDHPVTGAILREVPVMKMLRGIATDGPGNLASLSAAARALEDLDSPGIEVARHEVVKRIYEYAAAVGEPAAQTVAEALSVSIATAGRRIRDSKQALGWS